MPIVKYVAVHSTPQANIKYILNGEKNDEMKFAEGLNCTADTQKAYEELCRTFELFAKERFYKTNISESAKKEKVRIHHYIQSFAPDEKITAEEAHQIGVEWAKRVFGENHQVIVSTHVDKSHIHNHFAVAAYDLNGKKWYANLKTLRKARDISDEIAKEHGLRIIEKPRHKNTKKYSEWLAGQNGTSWKDKLRDDIDKLILDESVQTLDDLAARLREQHYEVRQGKYLSIKPEKEKRAVRSYRLGDGYDIEELNYRIQNKNNEISNEAIGRYSGLQREYALVIRQMQISVYLKKPKRTTYYELCRSAELLTFLTEKNITSVGQLEKLVNDTASRFSDLEFQQKKLSEQAEKLEGIISDGEIYFRLKEKEELTVGESAEYQKVRRVRSLGIESESDLQIRKSRLADLKDEQAHMEEELQKLKNEKEEAARMYRTYLLHSSEFAPTDEPTVMERHQEEHTEERKKEVNTYGRL